MDKHPHAAAIDRLGKTRIKAHFNITDRAIQKWKIGGIPEIHRNTVRMLGSVHGVALPELGTKDEHGVDDALIRRKMARADRQRAAGLRKPSENWPAQ